MLFFYLVCIRDRSSLAFVDLSLSPAKSLSPSPYRAQTQTHHKDGLSPALVVSSSSLAKSPSPFPSPSSNSIPSLPVVTLCYNITSLPKESKRLFVNILKNIHYMLPFKISFILIVREPEEILRRGGGNMSAYF